jgi:hypothetical protein
MTLGATSDKNIQSVKEFDLWPDEFGGRQNCEAKAKNSKEVSTG